jgi:hypothetical protein
MGFYWERHPDALFATLIAIAATYCSPDAYTKGMTILSADLARQGPTTTRSADSRPSLAGLSPIRASYRVTNCPTRSSTTMVATSSSYVASGMISTGMSPFPANWLMTAARRHT